jgi:outer membrane protein
VNHRDGRGGDARRLLAWLTAIGFAAGGLEGRAAAQEVPIPAAGLALADVVGATLRSNPDVQLAAQQAEVLRGVLRAAGAPFDTQLVSNGTGSRTHVLDPRDGGAAIQKEFSYEMGVQRLFRNGVSVQPGVSLTRSWLSTLPGSATRNAASVGMAATVPLLRDWGGAVSAASERAAGHDYKSGLLGLRHITAERVLSAVVAYWDYVAAQRRLEVFGSSEARAQLTADQTRVLLEAEERTTTDLTQILGNLSSKRVSRILAEQTLVEARQVLGLAIGLPAEEIMVMAPPATSFPALPVPLAARSRPADLLQDAYERREDLAAAEQDLLSAQTLLDASRSDMKPRLDVVLGTGYNAAESGPAFTNFFGPLYRPQPKLDGSLQLSYQFPIANSGARGRLLQTASLSEEQRIVRDNLRRRISTGVYVASEALTRGEAGMRESEQAVRLLESTVQAEQRKFQLGVSTLFDVVQAQDGLTNALLSQIQSQRNYAVAIATLQFQSGTLLVGEPNPTVDVGSLQSPP